MIQPNDPRLTAYVLGELDEQESKLIEAAISESPELEAVVNEIRETTLLLTDEFRAEANVGLLDDQKSSIQTQAKAPATKSQRNGFLLQNWAWLAAAACLVAIAVPFLQNGNQPQQTAQNEKTGKYEELSTEPEANRSLDALADVEDAITPAPTNETETYHFETTERDGLSRLRRGIEIEESESRSLSSLAIDESKESLDDYMVAPENPSTEGGTFLGPVGVEFVEGTDVFIVRGQKRDVDRVKKIIDRIEQDRDHPFEEGRKTEADFDELIDLITTTVGEDNWDDVGGDGEVDSFEGNLSLVISNTQDVEGQEDQRGVEDPVLRFGADHPSRGACLLYTSPSPRDKRQSRMPSSA